MPRPPVDHTPPYAPIDLPDDFGLDDDRADNRAVAWVAAILVLTFAAAAMLLLGAFNG